MYYVEDNNKIVLFDEDKHKLQDTIAFMPQYKNLEIKEVQDGYVIVDFELMTIEEKEQREQAKERERLDALFMTRSDFFDATIKAFGADENDLLTLISSVLSTLPLSDIEKKIALNNYKNALNFYRKHTLFTLLSDVEIPISAEQSIIITSEQWDKFFETKDYKELLPKVTKEKEE
jgi:hypothetical protein